MSRPVSPVVSDAPLLLRDDVDGVTTLTLNRPKQYNALSEAMLTALQQALDAIKADDNVRVVVMTGAGKAFCAGHDLKEMRAHPDKQYQQALFQRCSRMMLSVTQLPQPVIAKVHGIATAAGCQLVATCDLAVAANEARFATSGVNLGLFCTTPGVALGRNVSRKAAMEMLLTGEFVSAERAVELGLINRAVPAEQLDACVGELSRNLVGKSPVALRLGKQAFYRQMEQGLEGAYTDASEVMACNMTTDDAAEGIDAFIEKRKPNWRGH
jgi:enoyl-CoA hydratase/carnithine racemase